MLEEERKTLKPDKVEGIKVNSTFSKLHISSDATEYGTEKRDGFGPEDKKGGPLYIADDTV